jgi:hypothetical protein
MTYRVVLNGQTYTTEEVTVITDPDHNEGEVMSFAFGYKNPTSETEVLSVTLQKGDDPEPCGFTSKYLDTIWCEVRDTPPSPYAESK